MRIGTFFFKIMEITKTDFNKMMLYLGDAANFYEVAGAEVQMSGAYDTQAHRQAQIQTAMQIINPDEHLFIAGLARSYALGLCDGEKTFSRDAIICTYITAAEKTLRRVCNVIRESAAIGGITAEQCVKLLRSIEEVERLPCQPDAADSQSE